MSDTTKSEDCPRWRRDFPVEWTADTYTTRREFTKFLIMISGATVVGNGLLALQDYQRSRRPQAPLAITAMSDVPVGRVKLFRYPTADDPAILIRLAEDQWVAFQQRCTHLSCPVIYAHDSKRLECPCHNGAFDAATGKVLEGPPPRPLPRIALRLADGQVIAEGVIPA